MFLLFLFCMGTWFIKASGNTVREHIFRKITLTYTVDSDAVSLPGLVNTDSSSDVSCGYQCARKDWCSSFSYDAAMTTCSLYTEKIPVVASTSSTAYSDRCPASLNFKYETSLHFCYWISTYTATWQAANETCHNKGDGQNVWVDGNDIATEGTFVWSDGDSLLKNSKVWDKIYQYPQPDNGRGAAEEDCRMIIYLGPMLHDENCNRTHIFVCEYNL